MKRPWLIAAVAVLLVGGMVTWGLLAHRGSPEWVRGEHLTQAQADKLLRASVTDLDSAAMAVQIEGKTDMTFEGAVDLVQEPLKAELRLAVGGRPQQTVVRIIGDRAWVRLGAGTRWRSTKLDTDASGWAQTVLSQVAGGIDLRRLFGSASLGIRKMEVKGAFSSEGIKGTRYTFSINALAIRSLLPQLLTQGSSAIKRRVHATVWIGDDGRLLRFSTSINGEAVTVTVTSRNPQVVVRRPTGRMLPVTGLSAPEAGADADATQVSAK